EIDPRDGQAETEERYRDACAKNILHEVSRVRADRDHLAVRHVDHAHQAERNGEAEGAHEQDAAEAEAAKKGAEKVDRRAMAFDRAQGFARGIGNWDVF